MDVDIDDLYDKHHAWKKNFQEKDTHIQELQEELKIKKAENETLQAIIKDLMEDVSNISNILVELRDDMLLYKRCESKMKVLCEEKKMLKKDLDAREKNYENKLLKLTQEIATLQFENETNIKDLKTTMINERNEELLAANEKSEERDKKIKALEKNLQVYENEKKRFSFLQTEFEKQLLYLREQLTKAKEPLQMPSINEEIFRKKYENLMKIDAKKEEDIRKMQNEITELKKLNNRLVKLSRMRRQREISSQVTCSHKDNSSSTELGLLSSQNPSQKFYPTLFNIQNNNLLSAVTATNFNKLSADTSETNDKTEANYSAPLEDKLDISSQVNENLACNKNFPNVTTNGKTLSIKRKRSDKRKKLFSLESNILGED